MLFSGLILIGALGLLLIGALGLLFVANNNKNLDMECKLILEINDCETKYRIISLAEETYYLKYLQFYANNKWRFIPNCYKIINGEITSPNNCPVIFERFIYSKKFFPTFGWIGCNLDQNPLFDFVEEHPNINMYFEKYNKIYSDILKEKSKIKKMPTIFLEQ